MPKKPRYSMPDSKDRSDVKKLRRVPDAAIDSSDIPPLDDSVWRARKTVAARTRSTPQRRRRIAAE